VRRGFILRPTSRSANWRSGFWASRYRPVWPWWKYDAEGKEDKGDMGLGKSIVLGMAKFSCKLGQDSSAHASEVVQVVNTLSLSDAEKKTAFLATLQGYPLRMMSGMAGNPQFTFADLVTEFLALYGRDDRGAEDALNRAAREDRQEKEESTTIFRDRVHALALGAGKDVDQPAVIRLFLDGLRDEKVRGQAALENLDKLQDWKKAAARVLEIERAVRQVTVMDAIRDMDQKSEEVFAFHAKAGAVPQDQGARGRDESCHAFRATGKCKFGANCKFEHDGQSGQELPPRGLGQMPERRENCFKFLAGVCERGDSCKFYHDKQAARYIKKNVPGGRAAAAGDFGITHLDERLWPTLALALHSTTTLAVRAWA
jgi:hypothetical protein